MLLGCLTTGPPCVWLAALTEMQAGGCYVLTSSLQEGALVCLVPRSQSSGPPCSMGYVAVCVLFVCVCLCT